MSSTSDSPRMSTNETMHAPYVDAFNMTMSVLVILIALLGIFFNGVAIVMLRRQKKLRSLPVINYVIAQACAAILFLLLTMTPPLEQVWPGLALFHRSAAGCALISYVASCTDAVCNWCMAIVSIDRAVQLRSSPTTARSLSSSRAVVTRVLVIMLLTVMVIHAWVIFISDWSPESGCSYDHQMANVWTTFTVIDAVLSFGVPALTIFFANLVIIYEYKRVTRMTKYNHRVRFSVSTGGGLTLRTMLLSSQENSAAERNPLAAHLLSNGNEQPTLHDSPTTASIGVPRNPSTHRHLQQRRITFLLTVMTTSFLLLCAPSHGLRVYHGIANPRDQHLQTSTLSMLVTEGALYIMFYSHFSIAALLYIAWSPSGRKVVIRTMVECAVCDCLIPRAHVMAQR